MNTSTLVSCMVPVVREGGQSHGWLLKEGLENLKKAPLKSQQRIHILISHLIPRLNNRLVLGKVFETQLQ